MNEEIENLQKLLLFADGLAVSQTGFALADLYAEDCEWAQQALQDAGCYERGALARRSEDG